jgi:hypothetical protein
MDDEILDRRMRDWKESEQLARDAERAAAAIPVRGAANPLAQRAAQLRRVADLILASILEDMHIRRDPDNAMDRGTASGPSDMGA